MRIACVLERHAEGCICVLAMFTALFDEVGDRWKSFLHRIDFREPLSRYDFTPADAGQNESTQPSCR